MYTFTQEDAIRGGKSKSKKKLRALKKNRKNSGRKQTCFCGSCLKCKNRKWQREYRKRIKKAGGKTPPAAAPRSIIPEGEGVKS